MTALLPRARRLLGVGAVAFVAFVATVAVPEAAFAVQRVSPAPASFTVTEGGAEQDVVFTLDEPIIGIDPNPTVNLTFTVDDPSRLSLSPSTLEWDAPDWTQPRTLQVTAIHDGVHDPSDTVTVHVTTASGSEYYDGYTTSFTATIDDIDPAPTTTTTAATTTTTTLAPATTVAPSSAAPTSGAAAGAQLAMTGSPDDTAALVGTVAVLSGALLLAAAGDAVRRKWSGLNRR